jgi:hypothetical protein
LKLLGYEIVDFAVTWNIKGLAAVLFRAFSISHHLALAAFGIPCRTRDENNDNMDSDFRERNKSSFRAAVFGERPPLRRQQVGRSPAHISLARRESTDN